MALTDQINSLATRVATEFKSIRTALAGKSDTTHIHDDRYYTETEVDSALANKANAAHTHDDRYYTESEITTLLSGKQATGDYATNTALTNGLAGKQASGDYATNTALTSGLSGKANASHTHTAADLPRVLAQVTATGSATGTITLNAGTSTSFQDYTATGNLAFAVPTGTATGHQVFQVTILASGATRTVTFNASIEVLTGITRSYDVPSGELMRFALEYSSLNSAWVVTAVGMTGG